MKRHVVIVLLTLLSVTIIYPYFLAPLNFKNNWPFFVILATIMTYFIYGIKKSLLKRSVTLSETGFDIEDIGTISFKNVKDIVINPGKPNVILTLKGNQQLQLSPKNGYSKLARQEFFNFLDQLESQYKSS